MARTLKLLAVIFGMVSVVLGIDSDYLSSSCTSVGQTVTKSRFVESSVGLVYNHNMNCTFTASVSNGRYNVLAVFRRFDLESKNSGTCVDYVNIYDGNSISDTKLNTEPLCGSTVPSNMVSTGSQLTIQFVTDNSASLYGFSIMLAEVYNGSCTTGEYSCSNGFCVNSDLRCNGYEECGDASDEASCTASELYGDGNDNSALIAGLTIGLLALVVLVAGVSFYIYRQYRWRRFLKDPLPALKQLDVGDTYPVTNKYYKQGFTNRGYHSVEVRAPSQSYKDFDIDDDDLDNTPPVKKNDPLTFTKSGSEQSNSSKEKISFVSSPNMSEV